MSRVWRGGDQLRLGIETCVVLRKSSIGGQINVGIELSCHTGS